MKKSLTLKKQTNYFTLGKIANFDENMQNYIKKISKIKVLSANEEKELFYLMSQGDVLAKKKLILSNLKLVFNVAKKSIHSTSLSLADLIQEGNMGLICAVEKFNWKLGFKFSTYATWWIKQAMFKAISEQAYSMKVPVYIQETLSKYKKVKAELEQQRKEPVKTSEIAEKIGYSEEKIDTFLNAFNKALSLEASINVQTSGATKEMSLSDVIEDEKQNVEKHVIDEELKRDIKSVLNILGIKEKNVISLRFGLQNEEKKTLEDIGKTMGVTKECIRQIEKKAIKKISNDFSSRELLANYIK